MTNDELLIKLQSANIPCDLEASFDCLEDLTHHTGRVRCALVGSDQTRVYAGFWLHAGSELAFLGLWSGHLFEIPRLDEVVALTHDLLDDCTTRTHGTPWTVPPTIQRRYDLLECELVSAWPRTEVERFDEINKLAVAPEFSRRGFVKKLERHVDTCEVGREGFVRVRLAQATALIRFRGHENDKHSSFSVLIYGRCPGTPEDNHLLQTIQETVDCALYDMEWNNQIHWDDPYYSAPDDCSRPEQPRNAYPVE